VAENSTVSQLIKRQQEEEKREQLLQEHFLKMDVFKRLDNFLKDEKIKAEAPNERKEILTLGSSGTELNSNGFSYSYFFVSSENDGEFLTIDLNGVKTEQVLSKGLNAIPLVDGMTFKSDNNISVAFIQTNREIKTANKEKKAFEVLSKTGNYIHTFSHYMTGLVVTNDDATNSLTITIGTQSIIVKANEVLEIDLKAFKKVTFTTAGQYRFYGRV
jgi:hypothetical protein